MWIRHIWEILYVLTKEMLLETLKVILDKTNKVILNRFDVFVKVDDCNSAWIILY